MPSREPIELPGGPIEERLTPARVEVPAQLVERLRAEVGNEAVSESDPQVTTHARDWWPLAVVWATDGKVPARPAVVVSVDSAAQVEPVIAHCAEAGVPVTTSAGRSGVCGGALPVAGGVVLDVTGLDSIVDVDDTSLALRVEAGVFGDVLEGELQARGYTLGHWPQSIELSTVGGWLACRSAGQYSTRYGKIEDMVVGLDAVTGSGRTIRTGGQPRAAVGPDLTQLLVGSEGTLAVITEATLRVHPKPAHDARAVYGFPSFAAGLDACRRILRRGATPAVLRLYDAEESQRHFEVDTNVLIVLDEGDDRLVEAGMTVAREECGERGGVRVLDDGLADHWLERRNDVSALQDAVRTGFVVDTVELAGSWSVLPRLYSATTEALARVEGSVLASGHCSHSYLDGGCLYFTFAGAVGDDPADKDAFYTAALAAVMETAIEEGASISHHHGVGLARGAWMRQALGDAGFEVLEGIKAVLDPEGILNPGKLGLASPFLPEGWAWS